MRHYIAYILLQIACLNAVQAGSNTTSGSNVASGSLTHKGYRAQDYCCGVASCSIPVPPPPAGLPANANTSAASAAPETVKQYQNASRTFLDPWNILPEPADTPTNSSCAEALFADSISKPLKQPPNQDRRSLCAANPRLPVNTSTGLYNNTPWIVTYWADLAPNTSCKWTRNHLLLSGCTGNQLAPHMVLTAAHCVDVQLKRKQEACQQMSLVRAVLCYGFDRKPGASRECAQQGVEAIGVSWHAYPETGSPHDQAILFTKASRPGPYFQYNYIENLAGPKRSSYSTFEAMAYSGDGTPAGKKHPRCGCSACPSVPCGLARTGPATGPLLSDPTHLGNGAVSARLEGCGGSSGSCMTLNGNSCCLAVDSYSRSSGEDPCTSMCQSFWSSISAARPLSDLWSRVQYALPR